MMRKIVVIVMVSMCCLLSKAQQPQYQFSHIDISHGLSNNQVTSFFKDQKGFMWIGTMSGLNRFDGYQFKVFRHNVRDSTSLPDDFITSVVEGPKGKLWIGTRRGMTVYDPITEKFERNLAVELSNLGFPATPIRTVSILKDASGNFFFLQNGSAIYKYVASAHKLLLLFRIAKPGNAIANITVDRKGNCWMIFQDGYTQRINTASGKPGYATDISTRFFGKIPAAYSLFVDNENELWIYTGNTKSGVLRFNPSTNNSHFLRNDQGVAQLNTDLVVGIQQDAKGNIWICTDHGGVNLYNKQTNRIRYLLNNADDDKSLSQNSITTAYKDTDGTIWLGTYKKGLNYYHENIIKFPVYRHQPSNPASLPFEDVNRFAEDAQGNLWIGTNGGGLLYFDRAKNNFKQYLHQPGNTNTISNNVIVSLLIDHEQNLWIGSYFGGLDCYKNGQFTHYRHDDKDPNSLADDRVWEIFEDSKKQLWVGLLGGGLDKFDRQSKRFTHHSSLVPNSIHSNYVAAIIEDRSGLLWIGTDSGVDVLDPNKKTVTHYENQPEKNSLSNNNIITIVEDSRGLIWIGTRDGLNVFNTKVKQFTSFRTGEGLPGNTILNILEDDQNTLWISTTNGISNVKVVANPNEPTIKIVCVNYDELDGLQATEFNENAALKTSKGEMIFGGARGFNVFHPREILVDKSPQRLVLTGLQIFNRSVNTGEVVNNRVLLPVSISNTSSIQLKYNENILAIEFAALNFSAPQKIKYAYLLEGFSNEWIYTDGNMRKAVYTNLDPGNYIFHLKSTLEDGSWNDEELLFNIKILPPFWKTSLAYFIYLLLLAAALWFARRIILERASMRFEAIHQRKEAERIQAVDVMKTKFFTNVSHEFRTPLSLILSPLDTIVKQTTDPEQKKQLHLVQRNAKRLLSLINQLLDFRKMEVQAFSVQFSKGDIIKFAKDVTGSFSDISEKKDIKLNFQANTHSFYKVFDKDKMEKIFFNLLSNAFKYTPSGGTVCVEVLVNAERDRQEVASSNVLIKISDTGIGIPAESHGKIFEPYFQQMLPGSRHNYGTGIGLAITNEFVRLHNGTIKVESEPGKGTCFTISLPIKNEEATPVASEFTPTMLAPEEITSLRADIDTEDNARPHQSGKHTILLVEDNEDFRFYLKDNLKYDYNVIVAMDGKNGWEKVKGNHPDIVVSDVMMPEMNGIDLAKLIKTDASTSHIPVILLTAMTTKEKEMEGFQAGANDYITKPFTFEILEARIRNLLQIRLQLQKKFQKQLEVNPSEITVTSADEEFMKKALAAVEKNMGDPAFSVEDLSRELFMSRVTLYKKLLSITGKTPIEFIRIMRLKRAAQLLKGGSMNVSGVAYEVGFNNPKVFTRYFKEEFHMTPSQYISHL